MLYFLNLLELESSEFYNLYLSENQTRIIKIIKSINVTDFTIFMNFPMDYEIIGKLE